MRLSQSFVVTTLVAVIGVFAGIAVSPLLSPMMTPENVVTTTITATLSQQSTSTQPAAETTTQGPKWISSSENVVSYTETKNYVGQTKTVEGMIVYTNVSNQGNVFLDFHYPWQGWFYVVIFSSDVANFPFAPATFYLNKEVRVTGMIQLYQGDPEIIVRSPAQIEVAYMGFNYPNAYELPGGATLVLSTRWPSPKYQPSFGTE